MDPNARPRNYQNSAANSGRPSNESRRPPGAPGGPPSSAASSSRSGQSRAERFEDERKRITGSCFSKLEADNTLHESYITHIRIMEHNDYPQSPPPPNSDPARKKPRVIIIAVKSTTKVQLHKARENANGTFSIGKTWHMADLSQVENYVHMEPKNETETMHKQWAGDRGFTVYVNKPYYWEASTAKEKEFFIGSLVKIFNKYTDKWHIKQGAFPYLTGFSPAELMQLTEGRPYAATEEARATHKRWADKYQDVEPPPEDRDPYGPFRKSWEESRARGGLKSPVPPGMSPADPRRGQTPEGRPLPPPRGPGRPPTADGPQRDGPPRRPGPPSMPNMREAGRGGPPRRPEDGRLPASPRNVPLGQGTPPLGSRDGPRPRPSQESNLRQNQSRENLALRSRPSRERLQPVPGTMPPIPVPSPRRLSPQSSRSDLRPKTPEASKSPPLPASLSVGRPQISDDARSQKSHDASSFDGTSSLGRTSTEERRPNGQPLNGRRDPSPRGLRPGTAQSNARPGTAQSTASSFMSRNEDPVSEDVPKAVLPERRRPQMDSHPSQQSARSVESLGSGLKTEFHTPAPSPPPPVAPPPRRRPQDMPERSTPTPTSEPNKREPVEAVKASQPQPPPTSPLPQLPNPAEPKAPVVAASTEPEKVETPAVTATQASKEAEASSPVKPSPVETEDEAAHRPGLGPMIKKKIGQKDAANAFRKAAAAAGAFKPRAGGAAAKLFAKDTKTSDEPDGISGVFVPHRATPKEELEKKLEDPKLQPDRNSKERPKIDTEVVPEVKVSSPLSPTPVIASLNPEEKLPSRPATPEQVAEKPKPEPEIEARRKRRRSNQQIMNISKLSIDPGMLDERGLEFETLLVEFGWGSSELAAKNIESLELDIKREIARVEAGSWLNHLEQKDDRVEAVEKMLDRAIAECDELEGLLTLYNVELSSLNDDIAFIEAQSQGLQVQTANQRLLQNELKQLVDTISITSDQLEPLRRAPIGKVNGLKAIEASLVLLYKALTTIDPDSIEGGRAHTTNDIQKMPSSVGFGNSELASMQALQEKKERYLNEGAMFLDRLRKHMDITFGAAFLQTKDSLANVDSASMPSTTAIIEAHDAGRKMLWMISPLILFAKEIDRVSWDALIRTYQTQAGQIYQQEIRDHILAWRRFARRPTGEEQDLLFTAQEKEVETITGAARKLTVKRSQTLARGLRNASGDKEGKAARVQDGKLFAFDVFSKILEGIGPVLLTEQNFVTEFFHATSTDSVDFPEAVNVTPPEERRGPNLWVRKQFEADRAMAKRVAEVMEDIFAFWPTEVQDLVDWAVKADPLQGVGILCAVDRKLVEIEDSNQDFLTRNLQKVHERLTSLFTRFVDEQIRAIEDTKVKIKKRKGVIAFMKTFPHFAIAIENMLPASGETDQLEIRRMVDDAYQKINKAMFESLKVIAKESPAVMATQGQGDPEDKEALNYHILLIENMNHYLEEVDARPDSVLLEWKVKAQDEMKEHMDLYVDAVIRRPLGKLLEFIESTETLLAQRGASALSIAQRSSHSRSVFKKLVHSYDAKEIRKGIEALKKRVDKHFGDADDPSISRDLVFKVLKECEGRYGDVYERSVRVNQDVYSGEVEMDWGPNEVTAAFRR